MKFPSTSNKSKILLFLILTGGVFFAGWTNVSADQHMTELVSIEIKNQKIQQILPDAYLVEWETNVPATGKVFYGANSVEKPSVDGEYEYNFTTPETEEATTTHKIAVWGLNPAKEYYLRPASLIGDIVDDDDRIVIYGEEWAPNLSSPVPGYISGECNYITEYLKYGENNSFVEVIKLQQFLIDSEGYSDVLVTGFFDQKTLQRIKEFQTRYKEDILFPWGVDIPTGYVYITTTKKINELYCGREFELSSEHLGKMSSFFELTELMKEKTLPLTDFDSSNEVGQNPSEPNSDVFNNSANVDYLSENFVNKSFVIDGEMAKDKNEEQEGIVFRILSSISSAVRRILSIF